MTTTFEKMVAAMAALPVRDLSEPGGELDKLRLREAARAALEAIREPNDGPVEVVELGVGWDYTKNGIRGVWADMIDAILNEKPS